MPRYLLTYDLHDEPPSVYATLQESLEKANARHVQKSVWVIDTTWSAQKVYVWASRHMRQGDELVVAEINPKNTIATLQSRSWRAVFNFNAVREELLRSLTATLLK
ncbi:hypothetical protein Spb1_13080 [Planctopirus ephydatiae]|uniref:Uncharacterized protein n=1 Tax=Planctopirus ephydatiae TaxID=2528019 RepID=A0A518GLI2_9PLAN|nr:hypothetical protein [Planctopirus ephydatiae]QDV29404.1 hypothetical protein Spb1_13080 [Planctopirus ephydatiae]